jgi:hypothetical protein
LGGAGITSQESRPIRSGVWGFAFSGLVVAALLVLVVAPLASSEPDGLERVATDQGLIESSEEHALAESPLAEYEVDGVENEAAGTRVAGVVGVLVTFGIGAAIVGIFVVLRKRSATTV